MDSVGCSDFHVWALHHSFSPKVLLHLLSIHLAAFTTSPPSRFLRSAPVNLAHKVCAAYSFCWNYPSSAHCPNQQDRVTPCLIDRHVPVHSKPIPPAQIRNHSVCFHQHVHNISVHIPPNTVHYRHILSGHMSGTACHYVMREHCPGWGNIVRPFCRELQWHRHFWTDLQ